MQTIDEAFEAIQAPAADDQAAKPPIQQSDLFAIQGLIDGHQLKPGQITACALKALKTNKPRDLWTAEEAAKVLEEIKKNKGEK